MNAISERAEQIADHLVGNATGAQILPYDINGRQSAVDFVLQWPDGKVGALEVTLITELSSIEWQGLASKEGWRWPAATSWEFRPNNASFPYKRTRKVALRAVELCDEWSIDNPADLPTVVLGNEEEIARFLTDEIGTLRRTPFSPGIQLYQTTRAEFVDAASGDFNLVVEAWRSHPHMSSHVKKLMEVPGVSERHLFLVPVSEALPDRFFTDDFEAPRTTPEGFAGLDGIWVWSDFWHRYLSYRHGSWSWMIFPPKVGE